MLNSPSQEAAPMLAGMFDLQFRMEELSRGRDPLLKLNATLEWELFRPLLAKLRPGERKSNAGRPAFDALLMFKVLVLESLYNLSDDAVEYQIRDRLSFMRFLGLGVCERVPDAKTIWLFREHLAAAGLVEKLFARFDAELTRRGFAARKGQIVDASIVAAPRQRNTREENEHIKQTGQAPPEWEENPNKLRQKDVDARWTQKNEVNHYGYKNHISVDREHKLIRCYAVSDAALHDSQMFEQLLDEWNTSAEVWADSAYRFPASLEMLEACGYREHLQRKGVRGRPLTEWEKQGNRTRARVRARVEHVFGVQTMRAAGNLLVRTIGIVRARCKIGLRNLSYNLARYAKLPKPLPSGPAAACP
jgi:IS5 family transposase